MTEYLANIIVNGQARPARSGATFAVNNPAHPSEIVGYAPLANVDDVRQAIDAAASAFIGWSALSPFERADYLFRVSQQLGTAQEDVQQRARLFTREHGKTLRETGMELSRLGDRFALAAGQAEQLATDVHLSTPPNDTIITRQPRGVATLIVPWNWPLSILGAKLPQALMGGNTVIVKLAEQCPLASLQTLEIVARVLPPGVMNVIASPPSELGDLLLTDPRIRTINFTGSIAVGKAILKKSADTLKTVTLELGGNDAALVLDDADLNEAAIESLVMGTFLTAGQICMAIKRLYVHRSRYRELLEKFTTAADQWVVGDGLEADVSMGPLNNEQQYKKVLALIADARRRGATVAEVGQIKDQATYNEGYFQRPTIVTNIEQNAPLVWDEQFGPVVPIMPFDTDEEAILLANATEFGLCSSVWTTDSKRAESVARRLQAGVTYLNGHGPTVQDPRAPFGGVKQSGIGRNLGIEGTLGFLEPHSISSPSGWLF